MRLRYTSLGMRAHFAALGVIGSLLLVPSSPAQSKHGAKTVRLPNTAGKHKVTAHVGDTLVFDSTSPQAGSTGYIWRGPKVEGPKLLGKMTETRTGGENDPGIPGAPSSIKTSKRFPVVKAGKTSLTFLFSQLDFEDPRQPEDKVVNIQLTIVK